MIESNQTQFTSEQSLELVNKMANLINEKLGRRVFAIDIREVSTLCDFCIVAEGRVNRHVQAIAGFLEEELSKIGLKPTKIEGTQEGNWVILDYLNVMIHILTPEFREKYHLERLWQEGTIIDLNLDSH